VTYGLLLLLVYLLQPRLLFMPNFQGRELTATPARLGLPFHDVSLPTEDGETLHGWWLPHESARATLLFFHGNAGNIAHRLESLEIFHDLGLSVLIIDYRGYGRSTGKPSEAGLYRDGRAAWQWLTETQGVVPDDIILFGRSLGAAVASWLAGRVEAGGLIVESAFTSVPDIGAEVYWWLPVRLLSRLEFDSAEYIRQTDLPVLIVHSVEDEIIPVHHGRRLREIAGERSSMLEIEGGHNTGFLDSRERYRRGLDEFIEVVGD